MNLQSCGVVFCLLIDGLLVTSLTIREGNRWVWRTARSTNSSTTEEQLNPFASFSSEEGDSPGIRSATQFFSGSPFTSPFPFPRDSIDSSELLFFNRRGQTPDLGEFDRPIPVTTSRAPSSSGFAPSPQDTTFTQISDFLRSPANDAQRATQQLNLGLAHFTIPSQLGRPVSVTTPTSNHLTQDSEPLISSYSSLDAKSPPLKGFSSDGRSLLNRRGQNPLGHINDLEPLEIKPLPIDISKLPLESTERAEGIRKLWSTLTSRNEFAKLFDSIAGFNHTSIAQANVPFAIPLVTANNAEVGETVRAQSSGEASVIEVVIPPEIQPQAQELRRPQQLQDQRQTQPERQQQQLLQQQPQQQIESQQSTQQEILRQRHQQLLERLRKRDELAGSLQRPVTVVPPTTQRPTTTTTSPQNSQEVRRDPRQQIPQPIEFFSLGGSPGSQEPSENSQGHSLRSSQESPAPLLHSSLTPATGFQLSAASQGAGSSPGVPSGVSTLSSGQEASVAQFPTRVMSFVVRKLRLPGNHIANVVFVPAKGPSDSENSREKILHSQSVLRFFQMPSVQKSIRELNDKDVILVVEEIRRGSEMTYIISTVDGTRVYPKENSAQSREDVLGSDGNVWQTFIDEFGKNANVPRTRPSDILETSKFVSSQVPFNSPSRAPLTSADFAGSVQNPRAPLTRATIRHASKTLLDSAPPSSNPRISREQKLTEPQESPKVIFSPPDVFNPDNFNPFVPFTADDERTVRRSFPPLSQGEDVIDLSKPEFFTKLQLSPSLFEATFDRGETKLLEQHNQASKSGINRRSPGSGFSFRQEQFIEPRAAPDSARWPWPDQVPLSLDDFFINSAQEDFKRR